MTASDFNIYFKKAAEDLIVIKKLLNDFEVADSSWGFHAHQSIEKTLKALLAKVGTGFSKSHDLIYLFDLLPQDLSKIFNTIETDCELLNPFAVALRYDDSFESKLDRPAIFDRISKFNAEVKVFLSK